MQPVGTKDSQQVFHEALYTCMMDRFVKHCTASLLHGPTPLPTLVQVISASYLQSFPSVQLLVGRAICLADTTQSDCLIKLPSLTANLWTRHFQTFLLLVNASLKFLRIFKLIEDFSRLVQTCSKIFYTWRNSTSHLKTVRDFVKIRSVFKNFSRLTDLSRPVEFLFSGKLNSVHRSSCLVGWLFASIPDVFPAATIKEKSRFQYTYI